MTINKDIHFLVKKKKNKQITQQKTHTMTTFVKSLMNIYAAMFLSGISASGGLPPPLQYNVSSGDGELRRPLYILENTP